MTKGNIKLMGDKEKKGDGAENLFKEIIAENFPNWGRNWMYNSVKQR